MLNKLSSEILEITNKARSLAKENNWSAEQALDHIKEQHDILFKKYIS